MVLFSHSFPLAGEQSSTLERLLFGRWNMALGTVAVHVFFVISGYLITQSYVRADRFMVFAWHRALRLVPALAAALVFSNGLFRYFDGYSGNPLPASNGSLWTLSWEVTCYLACGIVGYLGLLDRRNFNLLFAAIWLVYFSNISHTGIYYTKIEPMFMFFLMGSFISINERQIDINRAAAFSALALGAAFAPPINSYILDLLRALPSPMGGTISDVRIHSITYILSAPFAVIYLAKYAPTIKWTERDMSYGIYIYAWPVQEATFKFASTHGFQLTPWELFASSLPNTLLLAYISCRIIEEPALRLKNVLFTHKVGS